MWTGDAPSGTSALATSDGQDAITTDDAERGPSFSGATVARVGTPVCFDVPDGVLAGYHWQSDAPSRHVLFCHANGFCASAYRQVFEQMPTDIAILALDLRGHGRTRLPADAARHRSWDIYADDIARVIHQVVARTDDTAPWIFAGHSMGAVSALLANAKIGLARDMRLIEPVIMPAGFRALGQTPFLAPMMRRAPLVKGALGRRAVFDGLAAVRGSYAKKQLFRSWAEGVLDDYLQDGFHEVDGGVALSCAPAWEAANFMAQGHLPFAAAKKVTALGVPIRVLCAEKGSTVATSSQRRLKRMGADVRVMAGHGHLLAMETPERAASFLSEPIG